MWTLCFAGEQARRAYCSRLAELDAEIAQAQDWQETERARKTGTHCA